MFASKKICFKDAYFKCLRRSAWWAPCQTSTWYTGTGRKLRTLSLPSTSKCLTVCAISTRLQNFVSGRETYSNSQTSRYIPGISDIRYLLQEIGIRRCSDNFRNLEATAAIFYRQGSLLSILGSGEDDRGFARTVEQNVTTCCNVIIRNKKY